MVKVILGKDAGLVKERVLEDISKNIGELNEFNFLSLDMYSSFIQEGVAFAEAASFLADRKAVLLTSCYFLSSDMDKANKTFDSKQDYKSFINYLKSPNPECDIYLIGSGKLASERGNEFIKTVKKYCDITVDEGLRNDELAQMGLRYVGRKDKEITLEAMTELVNRCPQDWVMIKNNLDKLMCVEGQIQIEDVKELVSPKLEDSVFSVISSLFKNNIGEALKNYKDLRKRGVEPYYLLSIFSSQFRFFYEVYSLTCFSNMTELEASKELGCSPFRVKYAKRDMADLDNIKLLKIMKDLHVLENNAKFKGDNIDLLFELFIVNFRKKYLAKPKQR
jgi:DNA polymerase-3 subunit delta